MNGLKLSLHFTDRANIAFALFLLISAIPSWAGYIVDSKVENAGATNYYTWTVSNEDQSAGLDAFAIEIPQQTSVLAITSPPPYASNNAAYWFMEERYEARIDDHDGSVTLPAPRPGMKLVTWWGITSASIYPPGNTITFSLATDASIAPGAIRGTTATYTPQNDPHYYLPWYGLVLGPSLSTSIITPSTNGSGYRTTLAIARTVFTTNANSNAAWESSTMTSSPNSVTIAVHTGLTVEGQVGSLYGIQFTSNLSDTNSWRGLANVLLTAPKQVWFDSQPATNLQRYYRVVPGPVSIP